MPTGTKTDPHQIRELLKRRTPQEVAEELHLNIATVRKHARTKSKEPKVKKTPATAVRTNGAKPDRDETLYAMLMDHQAIQDNILRLMDESNKLAQEIAKYIKEHTPT